MMIVLYNCHIFFIKNHSPFQRPKGIIYIIQYQHQPSNDFHFLCYIQIIKKIMHKNKVRSSKKLFFSQVSRKN